MSSDIRHSEAQAEGRAAGVNRLVVLPWKKSVQISFQSLKVRFFRSLITTLTLVLAVSFLAYVRVDTDVANGLYATGNHERIQALIQAGYDIEPGADGLGSSAKMRWIVILSLLVCTVGIVNAQLMAVTERFREIGTMKCLGALDRFVLRLFILEAGMQGLAGATAGAFLGAIFSMIGAMIKFGFSAVMDVSWTSIGGSLLFAIITGCLLSLLGVGYPAIVASRMQPIEAMRVEQ